MNPYRVNDIVMYASQGVCKITEIAKQEFNGRQVDYYTLKPIYNDNLFIYVPADNKELTGKMRKVLSKEEIYAMIKALPEEKTEWIENENLRKEEFRKNISQGDRKALIAMIKALYLHREKLYSQGKKMHVSDERFFKEAEKILYDEFALVLNIEIDQVVPFIIRQIENA